MSLKRTALEMVRETELDDPYQKVSKVNLFSLSYSNRCDAITDTALILRSYKRSENVKDVSRRNLAYAEQRVEVFRVGLGEFKEEEKLLLVAQDWGEEFLKRLLKTGKVELEGGVFEETSKDWKGRTGGGNQGGIE
ncbi:hypothetical protein BPAE_0435g00020 [Botrytis paeoniae]|uniref:Uncharacterized protein n=1 Tax=Botrytis paeoniae TaxID=278948 RepID=A0A4Z1F7X8_9HELO|nr:hypothetical protein BPAE_0435g00020 [Botrytis paeoniae]